MNAAPVDFDALVIGAGPAGAVAALVLARAGARVTIIAGGGVRPHRDTARAGRQRWIQGTAS